MNLNRTVTLTPVISAAPCVKCPFRKDVPIYLRRERRVEIAEVLVNGGNFPCHATVDYDVEEDEEPDDSDAVMCAGAAKAIMANGGSTQMMRIAERLGMVDLDRVEKRGPEVWDLLTWQNLAEGATADNPEKEPEVLTCCTVDENCLAPAGWGGFNGGVVEGLVPADGECSECGEPLCSECGGEAMLCSMCRPWDEEDDDAS